MPITNKEIADALENVRRGCNCGLGVADCHYCREYVLAEALEAYMAEHASLMNTVAAMVEAATPFTTFNIEKIGYGYGVVLHYKNLRSVVLAAKAMEESSQL